MKRAAVLFIATSLAACGGCIPSSKLAEGELEEYWSLAPGSIEGAKRRELTFGDRRLPSKWTVREQDSLVWSTISIVRAVDKLKDGAGEIDFSVSPKHAEMLGDILAQAREAIENLAELSDSKDRSDRKGWAQTMAETLAAVEHVSRLAAPDEDDPPGAKGAEPLGLPAKPMLEMITLYLNERGGGRLLSDLAPREVDQLREVLTHLALRLGFSVLGKHPPEGLRAAITGKMRGVEDLEKLEPQLAELIQASAEEAAPSAEDKGLDGAVHVALTWAPKALQMLEAFVAQWDRMEAIEVELLERGGEHLATITVRVKPGKQVRIADIMIGQPTMVFRGASRILLLPEQPDSGETVLLFEPIDDGGGIELHFEGLIYGLVRLLAIPIDNARLREVRVYAHATKQGRQTVNVAMLMEALGDRKDPRRLMVVQDSREKRIVREAFSLRSEAVSSETAFSYLTSSRRYTYVRSKSAGKE